MDCDIIRYIEEAAEQSRYHSRHWFRYLRKVCVNGCVQLSPGEMKQVLESDKLSLFQKISLKQAGIKDTPTSRYIAGLNQRTTTPMLQEIMKRNHHV